MVNFIYEISLNKWLIWNYQNKKLYNKMFYYGDLINLDYTQPVYLFLSDLKFSYFLEKVEVFSEKKFSIQELEKFAVKPYDKDWILAGYIVYDKFVDNEPVEYILGKTGKIVFNVGRWYIHRKNMDFIKKFLGNKDVKIFPSSLATIKCSQKVFENWNLLYLLNDKIKIISLVNWFYDRIEEINLWLKQFHNWILETFHSEIDLFKLNDFQLKVYNNELERFLEPIILFIKDNLINDILYLIWDVSKYPNLINMLSKKLRVKITPLRFYNKTFKTSSEVDLFCIQKNNV